MLWFPVPRLEPDGHGVEGFERRHENNVPYSAGSKIPPGKTGAHVTPHNVRPNRGSNTLVASNLALAGATDADMRPRAAQTRWIKKLFVRSLLHRIHDFIHRPLCVIEQADHIAHAAHRHS